MINPENVADGSTAGTNDPPPDSTTGSTKVETDIKISSDEAPRKVEYCIGRGVGKIYAHSLAWPPTFGSNATDYRADSIVKYWREHSLPMTDMISFGDRVMIDLLDMDKLSMFADGVIAAELNTVYRETDKPFFPDIAVAKIDWTRLILAARHCAVILKEHFHTVPIKAYMNICDVVTVIQPASRKILVRCLEKRTGGNLTLMASQANEKNVRHILGAMKLMNAAPLMHSVLVGPTVKTKILGFLRLLELYDCLWQDIPWCTLEKLAEFFFISFNWLCDKTQMAAEMASNGFEWVKTKADDVTEYFSSHQPNQKDAPVGVTGVRLQSSAPLRCRSCENVSARGCSLCVYHYCYQCMPEDKAVCGCPKEFSHVAAVCDCENNQDCLPRALALAEGVSLEVVKRRVHQWLTRPAAQKQYADIREVFPVYASISGTFEEFSAEVLRQSHVNVPCELEYLLAYCCARVKGVVVSVFEDDEDGEKVRTKTMGWFPVKLNAIFHIELYANHYSQAEFIWPDMQKPDYLLWGEPWDNKGLPYTPTWSKRTPPTNLAVTITKKDLAEKKKNPLPVNPPEPVHVTLADIDGVLNEVDPETASIVSTNSSSLLDDIKQCRAKCATLRTTIGVVDAEQAAKDSKEVDDSEVENKLNASEQNSKTFFDLLRNFEWNEIGERVKEWFMNCSVTLIKFFQDNPLITGLTSLVIGIGSFLGITSVTFGSDGVAQNLLKRFSDATRAMYYAERGMSGIQAAFATTLDAAKEILGIARNPDLEEFKQEVSKNLELATAMLCEATNNPGVFVNDGEKFLEFQRNMKRIAKCYATLAKMSNDRDLAVINPIWHSLNRTFEKLALNYNKVMASSSSRQEPVVMYLYGKTAIGKSKYITHLINKLNVRLKRNMKQYTISKGPKFWNGFAQQDVIVIDDMNSVIDQEGDTDSAVVFDLATSAPYNPNQASLEDKCIMATPKFLFIGSNHLSIPSNSIVQNRIAWERRRHIMVHVTWPEHQGVCPEYTTNCEHLQRLDEFEKKHKYKDFSHLNLRLISPLTSVANQAKQKVSLNSRKCSYSNETFVDRPIEDLDAEGCALSEDDLLDMLIAKEHTFAQKFAEDMQRKILTDKEQQTQSWVTPPHVFLTGDPGTGKTHLMREYIQQTAANSIINIRTVDDLDVFTTANYRTDRKSVVIFHDLTQLQDSVNFKKLFDEIMRRYDAAPAPEDLWILVANERVLDAKLEELYDTEEELIAIFRRASRFRTGYKPKPSVMNYVRGVIGWETARYCPEDVVDKCDMDTYVWYEHDGKKFTQQSILERMLAYIPTTQEVVMKTTLPERKFVKFTCALQIPLTERAFRDMINDAPITSIINTIIGGRCKTYSENIPTSSIGKIILSAVKQAKSMQGTYFNSVDSLILQVWSKKALEALKGEAFILRLTDRAYYADYTKDDLECGIITEGSEMLDDMANTMKESADTVRLSNIFDSGHSILPHWLILGGEIAHTIGMCAVTAIAAFEGVRDQDRMFKSEMFMNRIVEAVTEGTEGIKDKMVKKVEKTMGHLTQPNELHPGLQSPKSPQYGDIENNDFIGTMSQEQIVEKIKKEHRGDETGTTDQKFKMRKENTSSDTYNANQKVKIKKQVTTENYAHNDFNPNHGKSMVVKEEGVVFNVAPKELDNGICMDSVAKEVCLDPALFDIVHKVVKNCVEVIDETGRRLCSGLVVRGRTVRTVSHLLDTHSVNNLRVRTLDGRVYKVVQTYESKTIDRLDLKIEDSTFPAKPDITKHFPDNNYTVEEGAQAVLVTPDLGILPGFVTVTVRPYILKNLLYRNYTGQSLNVYSIEYRGHRVGYTGTGVNTRAGDCGSVLILSDSVVANGKVVGMHHAANTTKCFASPLRSSQYTDTVVFQSSPNAIKSSKWIIPVKEKEDSTVVGTCREPNHIPAKTKLFRNWFPIGEEKYEPSILSSRDTRYNGASLLASEALKWCKPRQELPNDVKADLMKCAEEIAYHYVSVMKQEGIKLSTLTCTQALNALRGSPHSEPINTATSPGFPWNKMSSKPGKSAYITIGSAGERRFSNKTEDLPAVSALHTEIDNLLKGKHSQVLFQVFLKDELVKKKKNL
nr:MAG: polyprotein [Wufeng shrew picorna-like virus 13]